MELIYTNDLCTGCNKCVRGCPVLTANIATQEGYVTVDPDKCIACGECFDVCPHEARDYYDDTDRFFEDLASGKKISVILAPAFLANYPKEYQRVLGYLKSKGVNHICSVSFGADITTWGYLKYITEHKFFGGISQPCPAVVTYVEKYIPELIPRLMPVHSPMMCTAIYMKKYMQVTDEIAFISPCIAKKLEITDPNCGGYVSYNVTFEKMMKYIGNDYEGCEPYTDELEYGLGSLYPMPGGLRENVEHFLGKEQVVRQVEGEHEAYEYLRSYAKRIQQNKELPFMVDILNCAKGCLYGTATDSKRGTDDVMLTIAKLRNSKTSAKQEKAHFGRKSKSRSPWAETLTPEERLKNFMDAFGKLNINDFMRSYTNRAVHIEEPSEQEKNRLFAEMKKDTYEAEFSNLGIKNIPISEDYPAKFDRLLCGGIWCIVQLEYEFLEEEKNASPIHIRKLTPIQMPHVDIEELKEGRKNFTEEEWLEIMLRSCGYEPDKLNDRERWLLLARMLPLVENNFNLCELGPRSTGKSHIYKEISPNSILVSGGQTTVANLFYNMGRKTVGLVGLWDCVAFDEVAGINFKDKDGIQIMKDYMASGSFARGKEEKAATASMVFVGNINQSVDVLLKTSSLFDPFPPEIGTDTAFLDRMYCYIPWEIPKFRPEHFTNDYGFITDYLAEFIRELRKEQYGDALDKYFRLGKNLNQRDTIAVRKMVGGMIKLLYPDGEFTKEQLEEILKFALEMRRRVKEQLKKLGGMEFYDVNFSYIDNDTFEEHFVSVPEQGGGKLIPEGMCNPGQVYTVSQGKSGMIGVFRLESQMLPGNGKFERTGLNSDGKCKEAANTAFNYLKANGNRISGAISTTTKDYIINYQDLQGIGMTEKLALPTLIALCSIALGKPTLSSLAVLGEISIAGTMLKVDELANALQVCLDSGAKKVLLPITSAADLGLVPADLIGCFNLVFYQSAEDAVYKALGVE